MNILMVEDDPQDAELLRLTLQRASRETRIVRAETIEQACQQVRASDYDVVLLDLGLPDSDGLTTLRQLHSANDCVPIVILSGRDDDALAMEAVHLGADDYMVKGDENGAGIMRSILYAVERHHRTQELRYLSHHDPLTGAVNRAEFLHELDQWIASAELNEQSIGVFTINLDRFRAANELLGHDGADQLLRDSVERVREHLRSGDVIARIDSDQLAVLVVGIADERAAETIAERIHYGFAAPFRIAGTTLSVTVSIGIALYPADGESPEALLAEADSAMHDAKEHGRNRTHFFNVDTTNRLHRRREVRNELAAAIEQQQFEIKYQPRFVRGTHAIHSVMASPRWHHPTRGLLGPGGFYTDAQRAGMLERVEESCIELLADQLGNWALNGVDLPLVSFPVSAALIEIPGFAGYIENALLLRSLPAHVLEISADEYALSQGSGAAIENIHKLHDLGVRTSISCCGAGFGPLRHASHLPLDAINLTPALAMNCETKGMTAIAHALIVFAHDLGWSVSVDGIRTQAQLVRFNDLHADVLQGDLFKQPLDASAIWALIQSEKSANRANLH